MNRSLQAGYDRGMTLVEVMIALAIFVTVMIAVGMFETNIFTYQGSVSSSLTTSQDAQVILKTMLTDMRSAAPSANGSYPIVTVSTSSISFFSDPDNDGQTEQITYSLIKNTLYRAIIQPLGSPVVYNPATQATSSILTDVHNSTSTALFQYFDQNYTGTSSPLAQPVNISSIRLIQINLTLDTDPNRSPLPRTYTTQASLRNLKTNL
jgi:prepilin-type N-terminal cleavage/methylation domain-containing protein